MPTLYITRPGAIVRKVDERIRVTFEKELLQDVPLLRIDNVVALGRVTVTTAAIQSLLEHQVPMAFLSERGRYLGRLEPAFSKNCFLRRAQYEASFSPDKTLQAARTFASGKIANQRTYLVRSHRERPNPQLEAAITQIKKLERRIQNAETLESTVGFEGASAAEYFGVFDHLIQNKTGFSFKKRVRRPPTDPMNAMLSFGYALLANDITGVLNGMGFDPYVGYLHKEVYGRASLALDLMEEFRPILVDSVVLSCVNKGVVRVQDFCSLPGGVVRLADKARLAFLRQYEQRKRSEVKHPVFEYKATYIRCIQLQARLFGKWLQGEIEHYPTFRIK